MKRGQVLKSYRKTIILCLVFAVLVPFAVYSNVKIISKETRRLHGPGKIGEEAHETRLRPLRDYLPKGAVVGYVADEDLDPLEKDKEYYLTQYSLCPTLVVRGKDQALVIGNYREAGQYPPAGAEGLALVKDFSEGLRLYSGLRLYGRLQ